MDLSCYKDSPNWKREVLWYPGEATCGMSPFNHVQKIQKKINRFFAKGILKYTGRYFTYEMLDKVKSVYKGIKGRDPNVVEGH